MEQYPHTFTGTTKLKIRDLIRSNNKFCRWVGIQTLDTNSNDVFFGSKEQVEGPIHEDGNAMLPERNLDQVYVRGSIGDQIIISVWR